MLKLNIGGGPNNIPGFINVDRKEGQEAYPLAYEDNSADEIRASHILEHFGIDEIPQVLEDWIRVLKPGGMLSIAVPDFDKIKQLSDVSDDFVWVNYLMGGQIDSDDYHKMVFTGPILRSVMQEVGLEDIEPWMDEEKRDCSSMAVSLNLRGKKPGSWEPKVKPTKAAKTVKAVISVPRYGQLATRRFVEATMKRFNMGLYQVHGVYWGQCVQRAFQAAFDENVDWILTMDYDSVFTPNQVQELFDLMGSNDEIHALAALQPRRGMDSPLATIKGETEMELVHDGTRYLPVEVTTAHFGLTLVSVEHLKKLPKPWFHSRPDKNGDWANEKLDDDIYFWVRWREAGNNVFLAPSVSIGHVEERVAIIEDEEENLAYKLYTVEEYRDRYFSDMLREVGGIT